jgi:pimeloyl-ACP methyl ester carboxylesterase
MVPPVTVPQLVEHRVPIDGDRALNVRERDPGDGAVAPFLLVHGLSSNARLWDGVSAVLAGHGHRVVAVDQRGHGRSDPAPDGFAMPAVAGDLVAVSQTMGLDRPVLVGQSWGGNVVIHAAALHPDSWRAVACVDGGWLRLARRFPDLDAAWAALAPPRFAGTPAADIRAMFERMMAGWPDGAVDAAMGNLRVHDDGTVSPRLSREDHRAIVAAMLADDPAGSYSAITVPVALLPVRGGGGDDAEKVAAVQEAAAAIPDARVHLQDPHGVARVLVQLAGG